MKNNVVETLSQVIIKPAISKPTSPLILSRYAKNFSKLNLGLIADAFLNFPIAEVVVGLRTGLDDRDLDISSPEACMTASCHNGILRDFLVELPNGWSSAISEVSKFSDISLGLSLFWCLGAIFGELFFFLRKPSLVNFVCGVFLLWLCWRSSTPESSLLESSRSSLCIHAFTTTMINLKAKKISNKETN